MRKKEKQRKKDKKSERYAFAPAALLDFGLITCLDLNYIHLFFFLFFFKYGYINF